MKNVMVQLTLKEAKQLLIVCRMCCVPDWDNVYKHIQFQVKLSRDVSLSIKDTQRLLGMLMHKYPFFADSAPVVESIRERLLEAKKNLPDSYYKDFF